MYWYRYEKCGYESREFHSKQDAENAYNAISADITSIYGYCDYDYLMLYED